MSEQETQIRLNIATKALREIEDYDGEPYMERETIDSMRRIAEEALRWIAEYEKAEQKTNALGRALMAQQNQESDQRKVKMVCATCDSDAVLRDAYAEWDTDKQDWVLQNTFGQAVCEGECGGGETTITEVEI